jgi:asparagine synthase (glutamine-hydrolysing)
VLRFGSIGRDEEARTALQLDRLPGSFSAVTVDEETGRVAAGRHESGAESLFFLEKNGALVFANSLALLRFLGLAIDRRAAADFLHFLYVPAPRTIFQGVRSLQPGWGLTFDGKEVRLRPLAAPAVRLVEDGDLSGSAEELQNAYETRLREAAGRCCEGIGNIALFLSGGKDSSALAVACQQAGLAHLECVTLGFEQKAIDESDDAARVAHHLGLRHHCLKFGESNYRRWFPDYLRSLGQPLGDPAALPVFAAIQNVGDRFDLFLDGSGNDSYFGFCTTWQEDAAWYAQRLLPGVGRLPWKRLAEWAPSYSVRVIAQGLSRRREEQFVSWRGWDAAELAMLCGFAPDWEDTPLYRLYPNAPTPLEHRTRTLGVIWEPDTVYRKVVDAVEQQGRLVRFPFVDRQLADWSRRLPLALKTDGRVNKLAVRRLLARHLPQEIVEKKKGAFNFPKEYLLAGDGFAFLDRYLSRETLMAHGLVDADFATALIRGPEPGRPGVVLAVVARVAGRGRAPLKLRRSAAGGSGRAGVAGLRSGVGRRKSA